MPRALSMDERGAVIREMTSVEMRRALLYVAGNGGSTFDLAYAVIEIRRRRIAAIGAEAEHAALAPDLEAISPREAQHVLAHYGAAGGWVSPGFVSNLLVAIELADREQRARLAEGHPGYVAAMEIARADGGIAILQALAAEVQQ